MGIYIFGFQLKILYLFLSNLIYKISLDQNMVKGLEIGRKFFIRGRLFVFKYLRKWDGGLDVCFGNF